MRILYVYYGGMGDCVFAIHHFRGIKEKYKNCELIVAVNSHTWKSPYINVPFVDRVVEIPVVGDMTDIPFRGEHFDIVYFFCHHTAPYRILDLITFEKLYIHYGMECYKGVVPEKYKEYLNKEKKTGVQPYFDIIPKSTMLEFYTIDDDYRRARNFLKEHTVSDKKNVVLSLVSSSTYRCPPLKHIAHIINALGDKYTFFFTNKIGLNMPPLTEDYNWGDIITSKSIKLIDYEHDIKLGVGGLSALINECDYAIIILTGTITLVDCYRTPTLILTAYLPEMGNTPLQHCLYTPNIILKSQKWEQITPNLIDEQLQKFRNSPKFYYSPHFRPVEIVEVG